MTDKTLTTFQMPLRDRIRVAVGSFGQFAAGAGSFWLSIEMSEQAPDTHPVLLFLPFLTGMLFCLFGFVGLLYSGALWRGARVDRMGWLHFGGIGPLGSGSIRLSDVTAVAGPLPGARFFSFRTSDRAYRVPNYAGTNGTFLDWMVAHAERHDLPTVRLLEEEWAQPHPAAHDVHRKTRAALRILNLLGLLAIASILAIAAAAQATLIWLMLLMPLVPMLVTVVTVPRDPHKNWVRRGEIYSITFGDDGITVSTEARARHYEAGHLLAVRNIAKGSQGPNVEHRFMLTFLDGSSFELTDDKTPSNIRRVFASARRQKGDDLDLLAEEDLKKLRP